LTLGTSKCKPVDWHCSTVEGAHTKRCGPNQLAAYFPKAHRQCSKRLLTGDKRKQGLSHKSLLEIGMGFSDLKSFCLFFIVVANAFK
jgi:hypothetical protein